MSGKLVVLLTVCNELTTTCILFQILIVIETRTLLIKDGAQS